MHLSGQFAQAEPAYRTILQYSPGHFDALHLYGVMNYQLGRHDHAIALIQQALGQNPNSSEAFTNYGAVLQDLKRYDEAIAAYDRAIAINAANAEAFYNRGVALKELDRLDEALASYDNALPLKPDHVEARSNRAVVLQYLKRFDDALAEYDRALAIKPDYAEVHQNASQCRLLLGNFEDGWPQYEWRQRTRAMVADGRDFNAPRWDGIASLAGKTILLHAEQGLGDTIQFVRYVKEVAGAGAKIVLEVQRPLVSLLKEIPGVDLCIARGDALPKADFHCPLLSLPFLFRTRLDTIPAPSAYVAASSGKVSAWQERLGAASLPRVGIVWSGSSTHLNDNNRSIPLSLLAAGLPANVQLVSLQKEVRPDDWKFLETHPEILHFGAQLQDFSDTAALVQLMDIVISVDTSVAHLAAAMGRPVWILLPYLPDWRWLLERADSPWYPTARLFRQSVLRDWPGVVAQAAAALAEIYP